MSADIAALAHKQTSTGSQNNDTISSSDIQTEHINSNYTETARQITGGNASAKELRAAARKQLGGNIFAKNWLLALVVVLINIVILSIANSILGIGGLFVAAFLTYGMAAVFLPLAYGDTENVTLTNFFSGTKHLPGLVGLSLMTQLYLFLWSLIPIAGAIISLVKGYAYVLAPYIKYEHPDYNWKQCLKASENLMLGNKFRYFCLMLSFIGWDLLGILCLGVGSYWVGAYKQATIANFYRDVANSEKARFN